MKKLLIPFFFTGTLVMMTVMVKTGAGLKTTAAPMGIVDLEFAYNTTKTDAILNSWAPSIETDNITAARINTYWDFLFLFFYAGLLYFACIKIGETIKGRALRAGKIIATGALIAGLADILENAGMLLTLNHNGSSAVSFSTTFISVLKWGLVAMALLYILSGLIVLLFRKIKN